MRASTRRSSRRTTTGEQGTKHTTLFAPPRCAWVTVTHPHHPLFGQQLHVVRLQHRPPAEPDLIVCLPDGSHAGIAVSCTDYAPPPTSPLTATRPLLDLDGLRRLACYVAPLQPPALPAIVSSQPHAAPCAPRSEPASPPATHDP